MFGAVLHDVAEDHETEVAIAFVECAAVGVVGEGGSEDVGGLKKRAEVGAAGSNAHGMEKEVTTFALPLDGLALEDVDVLGIGCVHHRLSGCAKYHFAKASGSVKPAARMRRRKRQAP